MASACSSCFIPREQSDPPFGWSLTNEFASTYPVVVKVGSARRPKTPNHETFPPPPTGAVTMCSTSAAGLFGPGFCLRRRVRHISLGNDRRRAPRAGLISCVVPSQPLVSPHSAGSPERHRLVPASGGSPRDPTSGYGQRARRRGHPCRCLPGVGASPGTDAHRHVVAHAGQTEGPSGGWPEGRLDTVPWRGFPEVVSGLEAGTRASGESSERSPTEVHRGPGTFVYAAFDAHCSSAQREAADVPCGRTASARAGAKGARWSRPDGPLAPRDWRTLPYQAPIGRRAGRARRSDSHRQQQVVATSAHPCGRCRGRGHRRISDGSRWRVHGRGRLVGAGPDGDLGRDPGRPHAGHGVRHLLPFRVG
jgi:hypothetical protein